METTRIQSGFDVELQFGAQWFKSAIDLLIEQKIINLPEYITITEVKISFEPGCDLEVKIGILFLELFSLSFTIDKYNESDSTIKLLRSPLPASFKEYEDQIPEFFSIPFTALKNLDGPLRILKCNKDEQGEYEPVIAILANLKIHRNLNDPYPRGDAGAATSFLPAGQAITFGFSKQTFDRLADHLWHTEFEKDGSHTLKYSGQEIRWESVTMSGSSGKIKITCKGEAIVDNWFDPNVKITITIKPYIEKGKLYFKFDTQADVDMGVFVSILAAFLGSILLGVIGGLLSSSFIGSIIGGVSGAIAGIVTIEIIERVINGTVEKELRMMIGNAQLPESLCDHSGIVTFFKPSPEGKKIDLSILDTIPSSIRIHEIDGSLYVKNILLSNEYKTIAIDKNGLAIAGLAAPATLCSPKILSIKSFNYERGTLKSITYCEKVEKVEHTLTVEEVTQWCSEGELQAPFKLSAKPDNSDLRIPNGKLPCITLTPLAIHREKSVVKEILFENNLKLKVKDAVQLQDIAAIYVVGYQLIHPQDSNAYFRAKADLLVSNNFEELPEY